MLIAHASDTHESPSIITGVGNVECDLIILTGDILNNLGRVDGHGIEPGLEAQYQMKWLQDVAPHWVTAFRGRDVLTVGGNHDFVRIAPWLVQFGHPADRIHEINAVNSCVNFRGVKFGGFREVPYITGEWAGEEHDMAFPVARAMACEPDVLVTHAPPAGILDECFKGQGYGVVPLSTYLAYQPHGVKAHFFGHAHKSGGMSDEAMGIRFFNGAQRLMVHEVNL